MFHGVCKNGTRRFLEHDVFSSLQIDLCLDLMLTHAELPDPTQDYPHFYAHQRLHWADLAAILNDL